MLRTLSVFPKTDAPVQSQTELHYPPPPVSDASNG